MTTATKMTRQEAAEKARYYWLAYVQTPAEETKLRAEIRAAYVLARAIANRDEPPFDPELNPTARTF
jgi:hypothetical protein